MAVDDEWQSIRTFLDLKEAEVACALLRSEAIECYLQGEQHRSLLGLVGAFIEPRLMVRSGDAERAREVLDGAGAAETADQPEAPSALDGSPEVAALRSLVVDLAALTVFTLGAGATRGEIERMIGEPGREEMADGKTALLFAENGIIVFLDDDGRMDGFMVVVSGKQADEMSPYPGFWEPGGTIVVPTRQKLAQIFGEPIRCKETAHRTELAWRLDRAQVRACFARGASLEYVEVDFGQAR